MYQSNDTIRNKWQNKYIDAKYKNKHAKSRNKLPHKSSNSLKQEFRNGKFNLQLFNRLYTNRTNKHYSLHKYLKSDHIYDDIHMILTHKYNADCNSCYDEQDTIDTWQCNRCTYINIGRLSYCKICQHSCQNNNNSSNYASNYSLLSHSTITTHSSLSSYISHKKFKIKRKKIAQKSKKHTDTFKLDDKSYKKFKKYMKKRKTSIIAYKKAENNTKWNANKIEKRKNNANKLFEMYKTLYLAPNQNKNDITTIIKNMASFIPKKHTKIVLPQQTTNTQCKVCYTDTNNSKNLELIAMSTYCTHCMICSDCFIQYLQITINDNENILPWILCPAQNCKAPINNDLLLKYASIHNLYAFAKSFVHKHLQRSQYWIDCPDGNDIKCKFGWIVTETNNNNNNNKILQCEACGYNHTLKTLTETKIDNGFDELIASGLMRECPECTYPTMKDYGMCNVMHCGKCGIYWNWRTKAVGSSSNEVKQKARSDGTLWEAGELVYQQNLQRNNLSQFIKLLARNGIKYDPNYRRGS